MSRCCLLRRLRRRRAAQQVQMPSSRQFALRRVCLHSMGTSLRLCLAPLLHHCLGLHWSVSLGLQRRSWLAVGNLVSCSSLVPPTLSPPRRLVRACLCALWAGHAGLFARARSLAWSLGWAAFARVALVNRSMGRDHGGLFRNSANDWLAIDSACRWRACISAVARSYSRWDAASKHCHEI